MAEAASVETSAAEVTLVEGVISVAEERLVVEATSVAEEDFEVDLGQGVTMAGAVISEAEVALLGVAMGRLLDQVALAVVRAMIGSR